MDFVFKTTSAGLFIATSVAFTLAGRRDDQASINILKTHILPKLLDITCGSQIIHDQRRKIVPLAKGEVLELGIGTGLNLPHYIPGRVTKIVGVDPADHFWNSKKSQQRRLHSDIPIERIELSGENIPLPSQSFDSVVVTYTLCTIPDATKALQEAKRLLRPGGKIYFLEHGKAPDEATAKWQRRVEPISKFLGGCCPGKDILRLFEEAGLQIEEIQQECVPMGPKLWSYNYWGVASVET